MLEKVKQHSEGGLTFTLRTYLSQYGETVQSEFVGTVPSPEAERVTGVGEQAKKRANPQYARYINLFYWLGHIVDVALEDEANESAKWFFGWWQSAQRHVASGDYLAIWNEFMELPADAGANNLIVHSYNETRIVIPPPNEAFREGAVGKAEVDADFPQVDGKTNRGVRKSRRAAVQE